LRLLSNFVGIFAEGHLAKMRILSALLVCVFAHDYAHDISHENAERRYNLAQMCDVAQDVFQRDGVIMSPADQRLMLVAKQTRSVSNATVVRADEKEVNILASRLSEVQMRHFRIVEKKGKECRRAQQFLTMAFVQSKNAQKRMEAHRMMQDTNQVMFRIMYGNEYSAFRATDRAFRTAIRNYNRIALALQKTLSTKALVVKLLAKIILSSGCKSDFVRKKDAEGFDDKDKLKEDEKSGTAAAEQAADEAANKTAKAVKAASGEKFMFMQCGEQLAFAEDYMRNMWRQMPHREHLEESLASEWGIKKAGLSADTEEAFEYRVFVDTENQVKAVLKNDTEVSIGVADDIDDDKIRASLELDLLQTSSKKTNPWDEVLKCTPNMQVDCIKFLSTFKPWYLRAVDDLVDYQEKKQQNDKTWNRIRIQYLRTLRRSSKFLRIYSRRIGVHLYYRGKYNRAAMRYTRRKTMYRKRGIRKDRSCKKVIKENAMIVSTLSCLKHNIYKISGVDKSKWPRDCKITKFLRVGNCDRSCGGGKEFRARKMIVSRKGYGMPCGSLAKEYFSCNEEVCPRNCRLSPWMPYSTCSKPCGMGLQYSRRTVWQMNIGRGLGCGSRKRSRTCNLKSCTRTVYGLELPVSVLSSGRYISLGGGHYFMQGWVMIVPIAEPLKDKRLLADGFQRIKSFVVAKIMSSGRVGYRMRTISVSRITKPIRRWALSTYLYPIGQWHCRRVYYGWWRWWRLFRAWRWHCWYGAPYRFLRKTRWILKPTTESKAVCPRGYFINKITIKAAMPGKTRYSWATQDRWRCLKRAAAPYQYNSCRSTGYNWLATKTYNRQVKFLCKPRDAFLIGFKQRISKVNFNGISAMKSIECCREHMTRR